MRCHYRTFNTRNIRETIDSFARGPYVHLFNRYVFTLMVGAFLWGRAFVYFSGGFISHLFGDYANINM